MNYIANDESLKTTTADYTDFIDLYDEESDNFQEQGVWTNQNLYGGW